MGQKFQKSPLGIARGLRYCGTGYSLRPNTLLIVHLLSFIQHRPLHPPLLSLLNSFFVRLRERVQKIAVMSKNVASTQGRVKAPRKRNTTDQVLGCFVNVSPSPFLDHLIRYLSTWSGTDKVGARDSRYKQGTSADSFDACSQRQVLMLTQYSTKVLVALLSLQHRMRLRLQGTRQYHAEHGGSSVANRLVALSSLCSDARTLYRIWGVLPIIKWVRTLCRIRSFLEWKIADRDSFDSR